MKPKKVRLLFEIANKLAKETPCFFGTKGPGSGNAVTNRFVEELRESAISEFGIDYSEKKICGNNKLSVDYYFPKEGVIVEVALGLKRSNT